jgi:DNA-3-methyladenine glycosylase II
MDILDHRALLTPPMGLSADQLQRSLTALAATEPAFARALAEIGMPAPRISDPGYPTLLRIMIGQQVSVVSAAATWDRLARVLGGAVTPQALLAASGDTLRSAGLSRQKAGYARSLAELTVTGALNLNQLADDDETASAELLRIKGIGRWSAEIYLLFSEGRPDIWPAGDLAIRVAIGQIVGLSDRPSEQTVRALAEPWRPHRGAAAVFAWHHYQAKIRPGAEPVALPSP